MLPYWAILIADAFIVFLSAVFVYWVTHPNYEVLEVHSALFHTALLYAMLSWISAGVFKTYRGVLRYTSSVDLIKLGYANLMSLGLSLLSWFILSYFEVTLFTALRPIHMVATFFISITLMWGMRILVKTIYEDVNASKNTTRVLIYGALTGGVGMAKYIRSQKPVQYELCGFISHEQRMRGMKLMGVPVYHVDDDLASIVKEENIEAVLVSPYRVKEFRNNQKVQNILIDAGCKIYMSQEAKEATIIDGTLTDEDMMDMQLHEVSVEDLLPRQEIHVDMKSLEEQLAGKRVLITGSAGSIGSEIVRQVAAFGPAKMMMIDQAESPQHDIRLMMARDFPTVDAEVIVTSISRRTRMEAIFSYFRPDYVFHAAAYKHVPMMEDNPSEAIMNNVYGTKVIADMSVKYGAKKFVMISTDKAVNPTNVMGCSKRICEIYVQSLDRKLKLDALNVQHQTGKKEEYTQFVTTRFGNVLGSNGSVIPLFKEQIKRGGPVTVTDERIVRFFMLIPEACKLVLEAGTKGNGGEIFVFDMGEPVKIADLAKRMIALSHAQNVEITYTGLREGEKLYEEVLNELEGTKPTFHEKIRIAQVREYDYDEVNREIEDLVETSKLFNNMDTVRKMKQIVPEYKSNNSVYESIDEELSENGGGYSGSEE
jgi:FlaA1/EpsC-like NDP-sugar epimerase